MKAVVLRVSLRVAPGLDNDHSQVASILGGVAQSFVEQSRIQASAAQLGNRRRARQQGYSIVNRESGGSPWHAVKGGEKTLAVVSF